jgi:hypothetical protein
MVLTVYVLVQGIDADVVGVKPAAAPRPKSASIQLRAEASVCFAALACVVACQAQAEPTTPAPAQRTGLVAQPCPELALGTSALDPSSARVFVEVADVSSRELPQPLGRWLDDNAVKIRSAVNLVAFPGMSTSMPWGQCVDAVCASSARSVTLTARLPERASEPIEIELRIDETQPEHGEQAPKLLFESHVRALHQDPVVLPGASSVSDGSLVLTAYLLQRHDDLQRVMECRARQTEQEKQLRQ